MRICFPLVLSYYIFVSSVGELGRLSFLASEFLRAPRPRTQEYSHMSNVSSSSCPSPNPSHVQLGLGLGLGLAAFGSLPGDIVSVIHHFGNPQVAHGKLRWRKSVEIPGGCDWAFIGHNIIVTKSSHPAQSCLIFVDGIQRGVFLLKSLGFGSHAFISNIRIIGGHGVEGETQIFIGVRQPKWYECERHSLVVIVNLDGKLLQTTKSFKFEEFDAGRAFIVSFKNVLQVRNRRRNRPPPCVIEIRNHYGELQCIWRSHLFGQEIQTDKYGFIFLIGSGRAPRDTIEKYDRFGNLLLSLYTGRHDYIESPLMICDSPLPDTFFVAKRFKILRYDGIVRSSSSPSSALTALIDFTHSYIIGISTQPNGNLLILSMNFTLPDRSNKQTLFVHCYE